VIRLFIAFLTLTATTVLADITGRVVGVTDGDTVTVLDASRTQHKIRLHGIDAPESRQDYGQQSKQALSSQVFGKQVLVRTTDKDRYGRTVGTIIVDGQDANLWMVRHG